MKAHAFCLDSFEPRRRWKSLALRLLAVVAGLIVGANLTGDAARAQSRSETISNLIEQGRADSALVEAKRMVAADSARVSAWFDLAEAQRAIGQMKPRRAALSRVLKLQPTNVDAWLLLAVDFFEAKQYDSAAYFAHAALDYSNRSNVRAYYWLGRIHQQAGQPDSALVYFRRAWVVSPSGELF